MSNKNKLDIEILVVDDLVDFRRIVSKSLREIGMYNITEAVNGQDALEKIHYFTKLNKKFDLILSDINMPHMTGLELLIEVRKNKRIMLTPFILISTENEKEIIIKALTYNVSDFIIKPFVDETIKTKVLEVLKF